MTRRPLKAEGPLPLDHPDHPTRVHRRERVERHLMILKRQMAFLFALIVFALVVLSVWAQANANRIEYDRYDLCKQRQAELVEYNKVLTATHPDFPVFPIANCGPDPRTD